MSAFKLSLDKFHLPSLDLPEIRPVILRPHLSLIAFWGTLIVLVLVGLDQWSKSAIATANLRHGGLHAQILPIFALSYVENRGISFGMLDHGGWVRWALAFMQSSLAAILTYFLWREKNVWSGLAQSLIIAGAIGNVIDRIRLGYVIDFLNFSGMGFPWVFNIADSCITIGVILWLADMFLTKDTVTLP